MRYHTIGHGDDQGVLVAVVGVRVEAGQGQDAAEADGQRVAHLGGRGAPCLKFPKNLMLLKILKKYEACENQKKFWDPLFGDLLLLCQKKSQESPTP